MKRDFRESGPSVRPGSFGAARASFLIFAASLGFIAFMKPSGGALRDIPGSTAVYDREGRLLRLSLSEDEKYRLSYSSGGYPEEFIEALLLKEDRLFFLHPGVNPLTLAKAFWHSYVKRDFRAGASTITMQLARLKGELDTGTARGKLLQILEALRLEFACTKREILEAYCALAPCGGNVEGFRAASLIYFGRELDALGLPERLLLVSIPQKPYELHAGPCSEELIASRDRLFAEWLKRHPEDSAEKAKFGMPVEIHARLPFLAPHAVQSLLRDNPGSREIRSTIDIDLQATVERVVSNYTGRMANRGIRNASALLLSQDGMEILAELGSADFFEESISGQVNGTEARRSPGSALKPFLYALAMDQSIIHPKTMLKDSPIHFSGYNPDNFDSDFEGPIMADQALIRSRNVPAVSLAQKVKDPDLYDLLVKAKVGELKAKGHYGASLILGTAELSMKELAALYGALANGGMYSPLASNLGKASLPGRRIPLLSPESAFLVKDILGRKPRPEGSASPYQASSGGDCAWKTGTSIGFRDAWSIGIFDSFVLAVWVGNFDGSGNPAFVGLRAAAPLMFEIIDSLRAQGKTEKAPPDAEGRQARLNLVKVEVCAVSGRIPNSSCPRTVETWFIPGVSPIDVCEIHQEIIIEKDTGLRRAADIPGRTERMVMEVWPSDLIELFAKAGIPRKKPPAFAPGEGIDPEGSKRANPQIISPLPHGSYAVRMGDPGGSELPFVAVVGSDAKELFWFLDERFLGKSLSGKPFFWRAKPGSWVLRASDDRGRSGVCAFTVRLEE